MFDSGYRWIIFKSSHNYWTVARRRKRSHIRCLPYEIWLQTPTGAEAIAEFNKRGVR